MINQDTYQPRVFNNDYLMKIANEANKLIPAETPYSNDDIKPMIVLGDSTDPLENLNHIKPSEPFYVMDLYEFQDKVANNATKSDHNFDYQPAMVVLKSKDAIFDFKQSMAEDGELDNKARLNISEGSKMIINDDLPDYFTIGEGSTLITDDNVDVTGGKLRNHSNVQLKSGSQFIDVDCDNVQTGKIKLDQNGNSIVEPKPIKTTCVEANLGDVQLGDNTEVSSMSTIHHALVMNSTLNNVFAGCQIESHSFRDQEAHFMFLNSTAASCNFSTTQRHAFIPKVTVTDSNIDCINAFVDHDDLDITDSEIHGDVDGLTFYQKLSPVKSTDKGYSAIANSKITNLITNESFVIDNSQIGNDNNFEKPIITTHKINAKNAKITGDGVLPAKDGLITLDSSNTIKPQKLSHQIDFDHTIDKAIDDGLLENPAKTDTVIQLIDQAEKSAKKVTKTKDNDLSL